MSLGARLENGTRLQPCRCADALSLVWVLFLLVALPASADPSLDQEPFPSTVSVRVLSKQKPRRLEVTGAGFRSITAVGDHVVEGSRRSPSLELPRARWVLSVEGIRRTYLGALSIRAREGELEILVQIPLEEYAAQVVAAETVPGTPAATLRAQAIVSRSYALAAAERSRQGRGRHRVGDLCDLAHCQVIRGIHHGAHGLAARRAAEQTVGQILVVSDSSGRSSPRERVYDSPFHASCGGHTADPSELFGGEGGGARAVADLGCTQRGWETVVPTTLVEESFRALSGAATAFGGLRLVRGRGGFVIRIEDPMNGRRISADAFVREVDRRMGWGHVRSARFNWQHRGPFVRFSGTGIGHGVGFCQEGASRMGKAGAAHVEILQRFYPDARLSGVGAP